MNKEQGPVVQDITSLMRLLSIRLVKLVDITNYTDILIVEKHFSNKKYQFVNNYYCINTGATRY